MLCKIDIVSSKVRSLTERRLSSRRPNTKHLVDTLRETDKSKPFCVERKCSQQGSEMVLECFSKNGTVLLFSIFLVQNRKLAF